MHVRTVSFFCNVRNVSKIVYELHGARLTRPFSMCEQMYFGFDVTIPNDDLGICLHTNAGRLTFSNVKVN